MPPGFGIATVEKIAVNAVMAGANPEHLPVVIAAVKALSKIGGQGGKSLLMSTSPQAPLLIVNGPVTKNLGLNARSALGPGRDNQVNTIIGRAFALCFRNIGHWYPNKMDMDTIGTSRKFIQCIAENEDASPWDPFHVDQGFKANESTVSVFVTDGELDIQDQGNHTAEGLLKNLAYGSIFGTRSLQGEKGGVERLILMPPDVARPVGSQGFSKQAAKEFIHEHARGSLGKMIQYMPLEGEARVTEHWKWLENLSEQQLLDISIPVLDSPDDCYIMVVGADRAKTAVFPSGPAPVTEGIDQYMPWQCAARNMKLTLPGRGRICLNPLSVPGRTRRFPHRLRLESVQNPSLQHLRRILPVVPARIMSRLEAARYFALVTKSTRSAPRVRQRQIQPPPKQSANAEVFVPD